MKSDANYDDLENSIQESLSETLSCININSPHNQEFLNKTIADVISTYFWSTNDFIDARLHNDDELGKRSRRGKVEVTKRIQEEPHTNKANNAKVIVPTLDFSYFQDTTVSNQKIRSSSDLPNITSDLQLTKVDKSLSKSKLNTSDITTSASKLNELKSRNSEGNLKSKPHTTDNPDSPRQVKSDIEQLLRELKLNKSQTTEINDYYDTEVGEAKLNKHDTEKLHAMALNLKELLGRLFDKRRASKRFANVEKMSKEEIVLEKIDTQKELLNFEERHGRPQSKIEKDLMRPLYDHYRKVKRLLEKAKNSPNATDLGDDEVIEEAKNHKHFLNLHSLALADLQKEKEASFQEKFRLKDLIKKYEADFMRTTGRPLTKEDREFHKEDFEKYKILKAKLKLIDALIEKHEQSRK